MIHVHTGTKQRATNVIPFPATEVTNTAPHKAGWSYLLAESLAFQKSMHHAIRIQKPAEETVPLWIRKLITGGQCKTIYVENLSLSQQDQRSIQQLCSEHAVSLIGLSVNDHSHGAIINNVVAGPWAN